MPAEATSDLKFEIGHVLLIDIVGYSKLLINEQRERLQTLNEIVRGTAQFRESDEKGMLFRLPTGDGMALIFRDSLEAPVRCALEISEALKNHPAIPVRMGIHSGPISEVTDVNERANVAGAGINMAQRVMDCGDAGHILLSKRVADDLGQYRHWQPHLRDLGECEVKHNVVISVVNLYTDKLGNSETPQKFQNKKRSNAHRATWARFAKRRFAVSALLGLIVLASAAFLLFHRSRPSGPRAAVDGSGAAGTEKSIAVLPFVDLSQAKDQEYFCDGISEEILDLLAKIDGLRVVARTSSFSFKGRTADVSEIAQKLNVGNILEGSLRREGNRVRITAQLVSAANGSHLWSETYERELQGVFALQDDITRAIVEALKIKLAIAPAVRTERNSEAHDLYLQGLYLSNRSSESELRRSLDFFQRALEKEPNSAVSWAGIAKVWNYLADVYVKPLEAYPASRAAAEKAVALDEREPAGHIFLADAKRVLDWDVTGSDAELQRALQLDPNSGQAHLSLALSNMTQGNSAEAANQIREAIKADPLSPIIANFSGLVHLGLSQLDEAFADAKRTVELDPAYLYQFPVLGEAYRQKGMLPEALEIFQRAQEITGLPQTGLALAYVGMGRYPEARKVLEDQKRFAATKYLPAEEIAAVYTALGEKDEAFEWLDRACDEHSGSLHAIAFRKPYRPLHSDPRFAKILKRIGLDPTKIPVSEKKP